MNPQGFDGVVQEEASTTMVPLSEQLEELHLGENHQQFLQPQQQQLPQQLPQQQFVPLRPSPGPDRAQLEAALLALEERERRMRAAGGQKGLGKGGLGPAAKAAAEEERERRLAAARLRQYWFGLRAQELQAVLARVAPAAAVKNKITQYVERAGDQEMQIDRKE